MKIKCLLIAALKALPVSVLIVQSGYSQILIKHPSSQQISKLKLNVEANILDLKVHENFINAFDINDPRIERQYDVWIKKFPHAAMVPFAIGKTLYEFQDSTCMHYLGEATRIDSNMAAAWKYMSRYESFTGNDSMAMRYMKQATIADPKDADCAYSYAYMFRNGDPAKYDSLMLNVAYHFPDNDAGIKALYYPGINAFNATERTIYYEAIYRMGLKEQSLWYRTAMQKYYDYLLNSDPEKAFDLAMRMVLQIKFNRQIWKQKIMDARSFWEARKALDNGNPGEAAKILDKISFQAYKVMGEDVDPVTVETLTMYKAEALDRSGVTGLAYDSIASCYSKCPTLRLRASLLSYGAKLGKDSVAIDYDISARREKLAWRPADFNLKSYIDSGVINLSRYKGKVVLVTYWSPSCVPCRNEFPYFEEELKKFDRKDVVYLAIDVLNQNANLVMPLVKAEGYSFIPLHDGDPNEPLGRMSPAAGIPSNYLIDKEGRVVFSNFYIHKDNEETLDLMLHEMLNNPAKAPPIVNLAAKSK